MKKYTVYIILIAVFLSATTMFMLKTYFKEHRNKEEIKTFDEVYPAGKQMWDREIENVEKYNESKTTKISREEEKYSSQALEQNVDKTTTQENEKDKKEKVITVEEILEIQDKMEASQKAKVMEILQKLGKEDMDKIMKMAEKGLTKEDNERLLNILKNKLSSEEINYLVEIANKYFAAK
ncbi:MAG TPA: hypothetical protein DEQ01_03060 [Thermoanaerobacter sp.]|nr:hypothetical protein [Thermoanaerobacter sp.]